MPISKNQLDRLRKIDQKLNQWKNSYISIKTLVELTEVTERTVKEDIRVLREEYDAPIVWSAKEGGYYYTTPFSMPVKNLALKQEDIDKLKTALALLKQYTNLNILPDFEGVVNKLEKAVKFKLDHSYQPYIFFESNVFYQGVDLIEPLLLAISQSKAIHFRYQTFKSNQELSHKVEPYFIKEHTNRWYLIGYLPKMEQYTTFALDRIKPHSLTILEEHFIRNKTFTLDNYFKNVVGMSILSNTPPEEILLQFTPIQARYFLSKPFHPYTIIEQTPTHTTVKMVLIINYELIRILAGMGSGVKVLAPIQLITQLTNYHRQALEQYNNAVL
ncbi:WYL domain-containing protein [Sphingobacteriales bacterium UPWRP_1]|nr:hypothetical protein B6N25_02630 [Sphingobacteriales bacterium TSM_CSS]PSJ75951.1 WYL domain-containing protein [Sphingobacteriales bacterium UPWRP_1]